MASGVLRRGVLVGGIAASLGLLVPFFGQLDAAQAATQAVPHIVSLHVSHPRGTLPSSGARVTLWVRSRNAARCDFLRQTGPHSKLRVFRSRSCADGSAKVTFPAIENRSHSVLRLKYAVRAVGAEQGNDQRGVVLREAARSSKLTASLALSARTLVFSGGRETLTYSSQNAKSCSLSSSPALWSGSNPRSVSCKGTTTLSDVASNTTTAAKQWTITFTAKSSSGKSTKATASLTQQTNSIPESSNWSGYILPSSTPMTEVSGRFTVPKLICSKASDTIVADWVGIGGDLANEDLLQTGVLSECVNGSQKTNAAWWELAPEIASIEFKGMSVSPGDEIEASVTQQSGGSWLTRVDDLTTGVSGEMITGDAYGTVQDSNPTALSEQGSASNISFSGGSTAEWIVEDPAGGSGKLFPFANYGTETFTDLTTSLAGWSLTPSDAVEIVQGDSVLSVPGAPSGTSFSVAHTG